MSRCQGAQDSRILTPPGRENSGVRRANLEGSFIGPPRWRGGQARPRQLHLLDSIAKGEAIVARICGKAIIGAFGLLRWPDSEELHAAAYWATSLARQRTPGFCAEILFCLGQLFLNACRVPGQPSPKFSAIRDTGLREFL